MQKVDQRDQTTFQIENNFERIRFGFSPDFIPEEYTERELLDTILNEIEHTNVNLSSIKYSLAAYYITSSVEASSCLARFDGIRFGERKGCVKETRSALLGKTVKQRIALGTLFSSSELYDSFVNQSSKVRNLIKEEFKQAFNNCNVLLAPIHNGKRASEDPLSEWITDVFTVPASLAGLPSLTFPFKGMNIQLIANTGNDSLVLRAAKELLEK